MAKESVALLKGKLEVPRLIDQLNAALAEEWLAYYQYWTAAKMVVGPSRVDISKEFMAHGAEELHHAERLVCRILELQGIPVLTPQEWVKIARCTYERPTEFSTAYFLKTIRTAEECAMRRYQEIADFTEGKDYITNTLAKEILAEEARHEQEMQDFLDDLAQLKASV